MLIILSSRTVDQEIAQQFGRLPPSLLPLGDQRLFEHQHKLAGGEQCFISIPATYEMRPIDQQRLRDLGIKQLRYTENFSITETIANVISDLKPEEPVRILYGDTLVDLSENDLRRTNCVAVKDTAANYPWAYATENPLTQQVEFSDQPPNKLAARQVVCGYFSFADAEALQAACKHPTITDALNAYAETVGLQLLRPKSWSDFGHLSLYFQSKQNHSKTRFFNYLDFKDGYVTKTSKDENKLEAEAFWFENLPQSLRLHAPRFGSRSSSQSGNGYTIEYLYMPLLADLFAFGELPLQSWLEIINGCFDFLELCKAIKPPKHSKESSELFAEKFYQDVFLEKTWSRLKTFWNESEYSSKSIFHLNGKELPDLQTIAEEFIKDINSSHSDDICFWHGDFFFGNIFYDFTAQRVICIDPRGQVHSEQKSLYGDFRYDLGKLSHSIVGKYDKVILGRSRLEVRDKTHFQFEVESTPIELELENIFFDTAKKRSGVEPRQLWALAGNMFFSMLPLHADSPARQQQLLACALRTYDKMMEIRT